MTSPDQSPSSSSAFVRQLIFIAPLTVLCFAGIYAHLQIAPSAETYKGPLAILDRAFDVSLAVAIASVAFCIGLRIARLLSLSFINAAEEISFSIMLGVGVIGLALLGLGLARLLSRVSVGGFLCISIVLTSREAIRLCSVVKDCCRKAVSTKTGLILGALFIALNIILVLQAMTPPHSPDESIYHLSVAKSFVEHGRVYPVIDNWAGNMPFLIQMLYVICLMAKADIATKLLSVVLATVTAVALYGFCARFLTRRAGVVAMFGFFGAGMIVEVATTSRIDVSLAGMLFLATYAMIVHFETDRTGWLYASAVLSGFSLGIKYTAGLWIILLGIMYLLETFLRRRNRITTIIERGLMYSLIAAAVASPWFVKNYVWFRNPIYPFATGEVAGFALGEPRYFTAEDRGKLNAQFYAARIALPELVRERESVLAEAALQRQERAPHRFWEYFTKPESYNMGETFGYPNYLFLLAPLVLFIRKKRWVVWLLILSVVFFIGVTSLSWVARLQLPTYTALTVVSAYIIAELTTGADWRWPKPWILKANLLPTVIVVAVVAPAMLVSSMLNLGSIDLSFIKGNVSRSNYMMQIYYYPPIYFINHSLPMESKVMMIGAQTAYDLERDYIADVNWDSTEWLRLVVRSDTIDDINENLKQRGVTHIWVAYGLFPFVAAMGRENYPNVSGIVPTGGPDYQMQLMNWAILDNYSSKYLESIYNDKFGNVVYRIKK